MHEVVIIGGGPAGLTAGMYCRMRKMSVLILDAGRPGGQLVSLYGDKPVHDWPGDARIIANDLAARLIGHARELEVEIAGNLKVADLSGAAEPGFEVVAHDVVSREEHRHRAGAVVVAIGGGAFEPRRLKVPGEDGLSEEALTYRMPERARAARFTGMESNIDKVNQMEIPRHFNTRVRSLEVEDGRLRAVVAQVKGSPEPMRLECDYLVVNIGAAVNLDAVKRWGIDIEGNQIKVDGSMRTSVEGIFACGDIVTYEGKYKLLITAASEGAVAANSAYQFVRKPQRVTMTDLYT